MSTRSRIGIEDGETGAVRSVYCHSDGYPDHNGRILVESYPDRAKVEQLIALGGLSSLGPEIGEKHPFDWMMDLFERYRDRAGMEEDPDWIRYRPMVLAYRRDRNEPLSIEEDPDAEAMYARATDGWEEYAYLWRQGAWFVTKVGGGAGPFLVSSHDPAGEAPSRWVRVEAVLAGSIDLDERGYAFAS